MKGHDEKPEQTVNGLANNMAQFHCKAVLLYQYRLVFAITRKIRTQRMATISITCNNAFKAW